MPLILQVLPSRQAAAPSSQEGSAGGSDVLGGLLGTLMGGAGGATSSGQSPQSDLLGALLGGAAGGQSSGQSPQADLLGALLGGAAGGQSSGQSPQGGLLGALLGGAAGGQSSGQSPQADLLGSLLGAAASSMASGQPEPPNQDAQPTSTSAPQASQSGGLLGQLGAQPGAQRTSGTNGLLDLLASSTDLDGDGVPDALERLLGGTIESDDQRQGGASLLEGVLGEAGPDTLATFSKAAVKLLSSK